MPILPLHQFETDLKEYLNEQDRAAYETLKAPKTIVVRFGVMKLVGEFPYSGEAKPGCGSKLVVRTWRGTELAEMLTSTCPNSGCSKSVSRKEMLGYIQNSGGRDYPFSTDGRILRVADAGDLDRQAALEQSRHALRTRARSVAESLRMTVKIVDAEPILGGETLTFYYLSEERIDVGDLHRELSRLHRARIELRQVGARDEARITADYEKCGQYCCCKNFLKVLKPVSMKSAKTQKATLDPLKISGRCGRLMCCLRYEDETYEELKKRLPRKKTRVGTPEGDGIVLDGQILTQLVLVELDALGTDGKAQQVAIPVENLAEPVNKVPPPRPQFVPPVPREPRAAPPGRPPTPRGEGRGGGGPRNAPPQRPPRPPAPPPQRPPQAQPPGPPKRDDYDIDLDDIETDIGDGTPRPPRGPGGPPGRPGRGKRRRR